MPKARENVGDQVVSSFSLHLIGLESGVSFLDQSQSKVKQNQSNPGVLSTFNWKLFLVNKMEQFFNLTVFPAGLFSHGIILDRLNG